jgi:hypothetical protein
MNVLRVFDPPMCCSSGVCGPSVDPELARFSADLEWLKRQGVDVQRFNLAQEPGAFVQHAEVKAALEARGNAALPLLLVGDRVAVEGTYPSRETLALLVGVVVRKMEVVSASCCAPSTGSGAKNSGCC